MSTDKLPTGWTRMKFGAIAASITERVDDPSAAGVDRYVGLEHLDPESTTIRRWGSPSDVESTKLRFYPGDVVYGRRRAYQRKLGVADFDGICSAHALVLRARPEVCLPEFLPYFLQSDAFHQRALDISVGSLSPTINWKTLAVQEFALPPIEEQRQIVEVLVSFSRVEGAYGRALNSISSRREAEIGLLAGGSAPGLVPLRDIAKVTSGESWSGSDERLEPTPGAVAVVGISSLKPSGTIEYEHPTYVLGLGSKPGLVTVDEKCVIVIRTNGNPDRIGNVYLATPSIAGCAVSAFTFCCAFESREQAELAFEYMSGRAFQRWATSLVAGSTGLKNLPINQLRLAMVPSIDTPGSAEVYERLRSLREVARSAAAAGERIAELARTVRETLMYGGTHVQ